jgi:predicted ester cyclase
MFDAFNSGNTRIIDEIVDPNFRTRTDPMPGVEPTREGLKQEIQLLRDAFPDARFDIDDLTARGDRVRVDWRMRGRHQRRLRDIEPTGDEVTHSGHEVIRLEGGKIVEREEGGGENSREFQRKLRRR